jgi:predicted RNase H-related nuclease YkuK (DUF458 family)
MKFDVNEIKKYILDHPEAQIIIGGDSQKISAKKRKQMNPKEQEKKKQRVARFVTCVIVYQKDQNKIFFEVSKEKDFDRNPAKPQMRMMQEVQKITDIATQLIDVLLDRDFEIHLDINKNPIHGSNCALGQATGYVWGLLGVEPIVKPDSWAASTVADWIVKHNKEVLNYK